MTVRECIAYVDGMEPNTYTNAQKAAWISECEGQVYTDVFLLHPFEFTPVTYDAEKDRTLAVYPPHDKLYPRYLQAMIHYANGEYDRYAASMQVFNAAWGEFVRWFSRTCDPAGGYPEEPGEMKKRFRPGALLAWIKKHLTPEEIGAVPDTRTVNGNALIEDVTLDAAAVAAVPATRRINDLELSRDICLAAADVGARPEDWMPSAADVGAAPSGRKINGHALTDDITLDASDVGAVPSTDKGAAGGVASLDSGGKVPAAQLPAYPVVPDASSANPAMDGTASPGSTRKWADGGHVHPTDTSRVPTSRKINGYDLTQDRTLNASDVGALAAAAAAVSAKSLYAVNVISFSSGQSGWYKFYEQDCTTINRSYGMVLLITSGYGTGAGLLRVYITCAYNGTISPSVRWLATNYALGSVRWELSGTVVKLYINVTQGSKYIRALSFSGRTTNYAYDPTAYWTNTEVEEPTNATAATGEITNYAARATSDGAGNNIADGRLWFEAQVVSAGTAQQLLSISDAKITADYVLARIEFADPSYITTGYSWSTASGSFTLTGTATAATTANVLLVRKGN